MKNLVKNRAADALIKTVVVLVGAHALFLLCGVLFGNDIGMLGLSMLWAHITGSLGSILLSVGLLIVLYGVIFATCSN